MIVLSLFLIVAEVGVVMLLDLTFRDRRRSFAEQWEQRIPSRTVPEILTLAGDGAERLEDHPISKRGGDVGVVIWRADLDNIHSDHWEFETDPAHGVQQFAGGQPAGLRSASARCVSWIADIDVDRQEHP